MIIRPDYIKAIKAKSYSRQLILTKIQFSHNNRVS